MHKPDVAMTELVANAWNAGATTVDITIPDDFGKKLIVIYNGTGLTQEEFQSRWMKLGYNRLKHKGKNVIFPKGVEGKRFDSPLSTVNKILLIELKKGGSKISR